MITPEIISAIQTLILAIIVGITTYVIPKFKKLFETWMDAKTKKIEEEGVRAKVEYGMKRLDYIVTNSVKQINQRKVTGVVLDQTQKDELLKKAFTRVKSQITDETLEALKAVVKEPDKYLITKIEAEVGDAKLALLAAECK